jgi:hypothetical protein
MMGASVPRSAVNDFLAAIGVPTRDTCRVEIGVHEIRVHSYDRLDDGEHYLGPDGVATRVDVLPIFADGGSVEPGDVPVLLQKGCIVSASRYGESHIEVLRRLNGEDA